jgi:hypothetical protein
VIARAAEWEPMPTDDRDRVVDAAAGRDGETSRAMSGMLWA